MNAARRPWRIERYTDALGWRALTTVATLEAAIRDLPYWKVTRGRGLPWRIRNRDTGEVHLVDGAPPNGISFTDVV